ncbi:N-acetylmuramidase domain-containing protein [Methylomonas albis]|uniref:N-acetylmuramidase domain-containing protein n=1 Tax=Methylomonas albis TaxID=1854563 RepID=UPI0022770B65|nr:N-acetylmuramidase domain-containing protein [Methylomonas albis]
MFHKLTNGKYDNTYSNISHANTRGYLGGAREYARLGDALALDRQSALKSASWGIGQVMGTNYKSGGFDEVEATVTTMVNDEDSQLLTMANFIKSNHLDGALQNKNWETFARVYNGANFKDNDYDSRLVSSYAQFKVTLPDLRLRTAQVALLYLGFDLGKIDGLRRRRTSTAIYQFQEKSKLPQTGQLDRIAEDNLLEGRSSLVMQVLEVSLNLTTYKFVLKILFLQVSTICGCDSGLYVKNCFQIITKIVRARKAWNNFMRSFILRSIIVVNLHDR